MPALQLCWRSLAIPVTWEPRSVSSVCSTLGTSDCSIILIFTVLAAGGLAPDHSRWISSRRTFFLPPLLPPPVPAGFYPPPHLGFPRHRGATKPPATLFSLAPAIPSASSAHRLTGAAHSLAVAMSALRRNHACCRAPLRCPTPPPISASSHPVRRLNPHLQPRISLLLRRAHWFYVSHLSECS